MTDLPPDPAARRSPLHDVHAAAGAAFTDFAGWQMPVRYSSDLAEHAAVRTAAGLFDLSHMGEVWVEGPDAAKFLDYALVGKISAVAPGKAKYALICQENGGIIDDLISYRFSEDRPLDNDPQNLRFNLSPCFVDAGDSFTYGPGAPSLGAWVLRLVR